MADQWFRECYENNMVVEYTRQQKKGFSNGYAYWAVFISDKGSYARFYALYRVGNCVPDTPDVAPKDFPHPEWYKGECDYYDLERVESFSEYEQKLLIDWGGAARVWKQRGTNEKPIVALGSAHKKPFVGYENVVLTYEELKEVIENDVDYEAWHTALSSIYGIYLIVDTKSGQQYVGSAYGNDGLLGRWRCYVETLHGNNAQMKELICYHPERYQFFQFSILQVLSPALTKDEVIHKESLWKRKLHTYAPYGLNKNLIDTETARRHYASGPREYSGKCLQP